MFRILLIIGLLVTGAYQSLARGDVELAGAEVLVFVTMDRAVAQLRQSECCNEQPAAETNRAHCKSSSECKAVISTALLVPLKDEDHPDILITKNRSSITGRLEPRPPIS